MPLVAAQNKSVSRNQTTVPATDCKFPFTFNKAEYYGCTSAGDKKPWCALPKEVDGQNWRYCSTETLYKISSLVADGNRKCLAGWTFDKESVFGCAKKAGEADFKCNIDGKSITCAKLAPMGGGGAVGGNLVAQVGQAARSTTGLVVAGVGGAFVVALVAGLVVARRGKEGGKTQQQMQSQWDYKGGDNHAPYGYTSETGLLAPGSSAGGERIYTVVSTYTPTLGDELEIQTGDKVVVLVEYDDGWCQGVNHSRGNSKGVFPKHCVDMSA